MSLELDNPQLLEGRVVDFLRGKCTESESIKPEYNAEKGVIIDAYSSTGISALGINPNSIIEIKVALTPDSITQVMSLKQKCSTFMNVSECLLLFYRENKYSRYFKSEFNLLPEWIKIKSIEELGINRESHLENSHTETTSLTTYQKAQRAFRLGQNAFILGAGVSMDAGLPSWDDLLKALYKKYYGECSRKEWNALTAKCFKSSIILAQYITEKLTIEEIENNKNIALDVQKILQSYTLKDKKPLLESIARHIDEHHLQEVLTFNYDDLLESELSKKYDINIYSIYGNNRIVDQYFPIYHLHGFLPLNRVEPSTAIITEEQYHQLYKMPYHWSNVTLLHALNTKTCYFIGLSMSDPNLRRLLDYYKSENYEGRPEDNYNQLDNHHYIFLKREAPHGKKNNNLSEYISKTEKRFQGWGIDVIWFDSFRRLPKLINDLYN